MTTILHDSMEGSAITNVEIRPNGGERPALSFTRDEGRDTVLVSVEDDLDSDRPISIEVSGEAFWTALLLLSGDATDEEVEALTSDSGN